MTHFTHSELSPYGDPVIVPEWSPAPAMLPARFTEISVPQVQPLQFAEKLMDVMRRNTSKTTLSQFRDCKALSWVSVAQRWK